MISKERAGLVSSLTALLILFACVPCYGQYGGPSILSRGGNSPGRRGLLPVSFTAYAGAGYRYETGLLDPTLNQAGEIRSISDYGYQVEGGLYGGHQWKRDSLGVDYRGDYRWQARQSVFNGTNQAISIEFAHRQGKRWSFVARESGGSSNRAFGAFAAPAFADNNRLGLPVTELFDVRTYFAQSSLYAGWQKSARTSINFGADGFFVKRERFSLVNSQGYSARATVLQRLDRSNTVGAEYQYFRFEYPRASASTNSHGMVFRYKRRISRAMNAETGVGILLVHSIGTDTINVSPEVAAILGRTTTLATFVRDDVLPNIDGTLTYMQERGAFSVSINSGVAAGNGVYLTSNRTTVNGGYSYTGVRRASIGVSAGWTRTGSVTLELGSFSSYQIGTGFSYRLFESLNFTSQLDYRNFTTVPTAARSGTGLAIGLQWSTSNLPLSIW